MPQDAPVLAANTDNFDQLVLENSRKGPVLVDFWASWAGPSRRQQILLRRLATEYGGRFLLVTVETDKQMPIADRFGVRGLPSCKLFRNAQVVEHVHGMQTEADYRTLIERHILPLAGKVQAAAISAWQQGDQDKAIQVLAEGAMAEPDNPALPLMMAKLLVRQGRHQDAFEVLDSLPAALASEPDIGKLSTHLSLILAAERAAPVKSLDAALARDPTDLETRFARAAIAMTTDDFDAALEHLAEIQRLDADYRHGLVRQASLVVLELLGPDDQRTRRFRQSLFQH